MHKAIDARLIVLEWLDVHNLQLTIRWSKWFKKVSRHIAIQGGQNHQFGKHHAIIQTMRYYLQKLYKKDDYRQPHKEKIIEDIIVVNFTTSMNTDKNSVEMEVVDVVVTDEDLGTANG